jgi:hypothetical protein
MKGLLILLFLLVGKVSAFELSTSIYTYHWFDAYGASDKYANRVNDNGRLINNSVYGFGLDGESRIHTVLVGEDSIGSPIVGYVNSPKSMFGFVFGAYSNDKRPWKKSGVINPTVIGLDYRYGVIPIIGVEFSPKLYEGKDFYIKFRNVITPVITNHSLVLGVDF